MTKPSVGCLGALFSIGMVLVAGPTPLMNPAWAAVPHRVGATRFAAAHSSGLNQVVRFEPAATYAVGSGPLSVALVDLNRDGRDDVVIGTGSTGDPRNDHRLFVFLQGLNGALGRPQRLHTDGGDGSTMRLATGDLNGDGLPDLAVSVATGVDLFYDGLSGLSAPTLIPMPSLVLQVVVADVNHDGVADLVVDSVSGVSVLLGSGGGFGQSSTITTTVQSEIKVADVTGDGLPDVIGFTQSAVHVFRQLADGSFVLHDYDLQSHWFPAAIDIGDVTGDGRLDVVMARGGNRPTSALDVFVQTPGGRLAPPVVERSYDIPGAIVAADVTGDGLDDVVVAHNGWEDIGVYCQLSDGQEHLFPLPWSNGYDALGVAVGDVSGDGKADILIADPDNGLLLLRQA